jgi:hypothetical protein
MRRRKWDEQTIAQTLAPVVADLGRMPSRSELAARNLTALWSAMRRNGGAGAWAQRIGELHGHAAARRSTPAEERIRMRAYFLAMEGAPGGPEAHWLRAERELQA